MKGYGLRFHHLGLAVSKPERAVRFLEGLGYTAGERQFDQGQNVNLIWCEAPGQPAVEIIFPAEGPGPLDSILSRYPEMVYHICYSTSDAQAALAKLKGDGHRVLPVSGAKDAPLFGGRKVSFYQVSGFGLIEIVEEQ